MIWNSGQTDMWDRLGRLSGLCEISAHAVHAGDLSRGRTVRWELTICPRGAASDRMSIRACESTLVDAVASALAQAEALGWMSPGGRSG